MLTVSVITVTYNNAEGLRRTLKSLVSLIKKPEEVIVIDGGSSDATKEVINEYDHVLQIVFISEKDEGIYDAMNKGLGMAKYNTVHYLNAGDYVEGEPYQDVKIGLLPVRVVDEEGLHLSFDKIKLWGNGYCHQGIIFPNHHPLYNTLFKIASDIDLIIRVFPLGLKSLPLCETGGVVYDLSGISSNMRFARDYEIAQVLYNRRGILIVSKFVLLALLKSAMPKSVRRWIRKLSNESKAK